MNKEQGSGRCSDHVCATVCPFAISMMPDYHCSKIDLMPAQNVFSMCGANYKSCHEYSTLRGRGYDSRSLDVRRPGMIFKQESIQQIRKNYPVT